MSGGPYPKIGPPDWDQARWNAQASAVHPRNNPGGVRLISAGPNEIEVLRDMIEGDGTTSLCLTRRDAQDGAEDPLAANVDAPLVARLTFGAGQASEEVLFDWLNGTIVSFPAGGFSLYCRYPQNQGPLPQAPLRMSVGAMVCTDVARSGGFGSMPMARYTQRIGDLNNGADVLAIVPARAHAVRLFTNRPQSYGSYLVGFVDAANKARTEQYSMLATGPEEMPLSAGTRGIVIASTAGVTTRITLQWSIAL